MKYSVWDTVAARPRFALPGTRPTHRHNEASAITYFRPRREGPFGEVLFIGEDTPTPAMPERRYRPRHRPPPRSDDDVLFIGDE